MSRISFTFGPKLKIVRSFQNGIVPKPEYELPPEIVAVVQNKVKHQN